MRVNKAMVAILAESRKPLVVDEITLPEALEAGQVLVKVLFTSIWMLLQSDLQQAKRLLVPHSSPVTRIRSRLPLPT